MVSSSDFGRDIIEVIIGVNDPATLKVTCDGDSSANDTFVEKVDG